MADIVVHLLKNNAYKLELSFSRNVIFPKPKNQSRIIETGTSGNTHTRYISTRIALATK